MVANPSEIPASVNESKLVVNSPDILPPTNVSKLGLAVRQFGSQNHIGIIYKPAENDEVWLLNFASDKCLLNQKVFHHYVWVDCEFDSVTKSVLTPMLQEIAKENHDTIPYGIKYEPARAYFDPLGKWTGGSEGDDGLTCATFVMAVFDRFALPLIKTDEWPIDRPEDIEWKKTNFLEMLRNLNVSPVHIIKQTEHIENQARFKPEEVAGATTYTDTPVGFNEVQQAAKAVLDELSAYKVRVPN